MAVAATSHHPGDGLGDKLAIYAMDGALLGLFMISACVNVVVPEHPGKAQP